MPSRDFRRITATLTRIAAVGAILIGAAWLVFWFTGIAPRWSAAGVITVKTNMAVGQVLAGAALLFLAPLTRGSVRRNAGRVAAAVVLLIGALTLSQHLLNYDLGIDQLLAAEPAGAAATVSPNRIGVPGSLSLLLLGLGLLFLSSRHCLVTPWLGVAVCVVNLIPAIGFVYGIRGFYSEARFTGIAWSTVVALLSLGSALFVVRPDQPPTAQLLRNDAGGTLLRRLLPAMVLIPLILGFLRDQGEHHGLYDSAAGTGTLSILLVLGFVFIIWRTAGSLSQTAAAKAESEQALRDSEKRYRNLFESIDEGFCIIEVLFDAGGCPNDWKYLEVNPAFERHNGLQHATGRRILELVPRIEPRWFELYGRVATTGESTRVEEFSGALNRWFDVFAFRVGAPEEHKVAILFNDITRRKQFQQELERLVAERTAKLQEVIGELEHYSYTITHDMRAPLRTIRGFAEFMAESCAGCQEQQSREFLDRIIRAGSRMDRLITDTLTYSKAAREEMVLQPVDPAALLSGMLASYPELQPAQAQIEIQGHLPAVLANEAGLTQVFSNLLSNAVKFVKAGDKPRIIIRAEPRESGVRLWFEDNGIGIPAPMLAHVFEVFSRGHQGYEGTGVGLALVRKVIGRLGGKVGVESVPGSGSRFWIELSPATADMGVQHSIRDV